MLDRRLLEAIELSLDEDDETSEPDSCRFELSFDENRRPRRSKPVYRMTYEEILIEVGWSKD